MPQWELDISHSSLSLESILLKFDSLVEFSSLIYINTYLQIER